MSYRQSRYDRGSGGGGFQNRQGADSPRRGGGGLMDMSIPSLLSLDVPTQNRLEQRQMALGSGFSVGLGSGLLGNAPIEFDGLSSINRQSLLGPGPLSLSSGMGSGLGNIGISQSLGGGDGLGRYNDYDSFGGGMGGLGNYGGRQANLGQMGGAVDDALAAKVRLQQAMLAAQAVQNQSHSGLGSFSMGGGYQSAGLDFRGTQSLRRDFDNRKRDTGQRGGRLMNRRGGNLQQPYNRNRDNRNQDRNRNQQTQQQRNRDQQTQQQRNRDRNRQNKRDDAGNRQQQPRRLIKSKERKSKEREKRDPKKEQVTKESKSASDEAKDSSEEKEDADAPVGIEVGDDDTEEIYDPSEPTEEEAAMKGEVSSEESGKKRKRTESTDEAKNLDDITVTIKQDDDGRAVAEPPRKKAAVDGESQDEKKSEDKDGEPKPDWYCHVCQARCVNLMNYENHMKGNRHRQNMDKIKQVAEFQTKQAKARLQAQKHIKNVLGDTDRKYCEDCKDYYRGPIVEHRQSADHKNAKKEGRPHCRVCKVTFKTPKKFVAHCNTPGHKKVYDLARKKAEEEARKSGKEFKEDEEGFLPANLEDFVTVDAVGFEDDSDSDDDSALSSSQISAPGTPKGDTHNGADGDTHSGSDSSKSKSVIAKRKKAEKTVSGKVQGDTSRTADSGSLPPVTSTHKSSASSSKAGAAFAAKLQAAEGPSDTASIGEADFDIGPYNPDTAFGQDYVVPVAGFFCKLCHKFYNNENNAKFNHCKTKAHYMAVKKFLNKKKEELIKKMKMQSSVAKEPLPSKSGKKETPSATPKEGGSVSDTDKEKTAADDSTDPADEKMETDQVKSKDEPEDVVAEGAQSEGKGASEVKGAEAKVEEDSAKESKTERDTAGEDVSEVKGEDTEGESSANDQSQEEGGKVDQEEADEKSDISNLLSDIDDALGLDAKAQGGAGGEERLGLDSKAQGGAGGEESGIKIEDVKVQVTADAVESGKDGEETEKVEDAGEEKAEKGDADEEKMETGDATKDGDVGEASKDEAEDGNQDGEKAQKGDADEEKMETGDANKDDDEEEVVTETVTPRRGRSVRGGAVRGGRGKKIKKK